MNIKLCILAASLLIPLPAIRASQPPEVWGLDKSIITKFDFDRDNLLKQCSLDAQEWRSKAYPNLPADIHRLPIPSAHYPGIWYWDSCFTSQQFMADNVTYSVAEDTFSMLCWELDQFGKIDNQIWAAVQENGHPRSQMPLFIWMADSMYQVGNDPVFLKKAYDYGKLEMNGFWMDAARPRPRIDTGTGLNHNDSDDNSQGNERRRESAWEHGWDNSARMDTPTGNWFRVLPVDLNAVLYFNEKKLAEWGAILKQKGCDIPQAEIDQWSVRAAKRQAAMERYFYNPVKKFYFDYDLDQSKQTDYDSLAPSWLVWSGALDDARRKEVADYFDAKFIEPYNLPPVTLSSKLPSFGTSCNWSYPNSWSPVTYLMADGFSRHDDLAPITETLVDKFLQYNSGRSETSSVDGSPAGQAVLGWGMACYFKIVQGLKLGFLADMTGHTITLRPRHIIDGMGGRFNVPKHEDVSVTYVKDGTKTVGANIASRENYNVKIELYFDTNTNISCYPVYVNGKRLKANEYQLVSLNRDSKMEGCSVTVQLTPGVSCEVRVGDPKFKSSQSESP